MKTCRKCQQSKVEFHFHADHRKADGLATICRECSRESHDHSESVRRSRARAAQRRWMFGHVLAPMAGCEE